VQLLLPPLCCYENDSSVPKSQPPVELTCYETDYTTKLTNYNPKGLQESPAALGV